MSHQNFGEFTQSDQEYKKVKRAFLTSHHIKNLTEFGHRKRYYNVNVAISTVASIGHENIIGSIGI